jgi:nitroreductase
MRRGGCVISKSAVDAFSGVVDRSLVLDPIDKKYLINQARNRLTARAPKTAPVKTPVVSATSLKTLEDSVADLVGATRLEPTGGNCPACRAARGLICLSRRRRTYGLPAMTTVSTTTLLARLNWRYATKKFDPARKIPGATWASLEQALVLSPSSYGLQPYRFIVVTDPKLRETLKPLSWGQAQVTEASHFVVFARKTTLTEADVTKLVDMTTAARGTPRGSLQSYHDMMVGDLVKGPRNAWVSEWAARQTYIALGNLLTSAALLGIDACPMEGLDPAKFDEVLGLPAQGYSTVCVCALGYRAPDDKYATAKKVRYPAGELIEHR